MLVLVPLSPHQALPLAKHVPQRSALVSRCFTVSLNVVFLAADQEDRWKPFFLVGEDSFFFHQII